MRIALGCDHAGFGLKGQVMALIRALGHEVEDCGCYTAEAVDFPDIAQAVCQRVRREQAERAVLVCGTGVGACIAANKVPGIRSAVCHDVHSAHQAVEHDDVNVMCLGAQIVGAWLAGDLLAAFLGAHFSTEETFHRRVAKLREMELAAARELLRETH